jgi:hypothetical protein
MALLSAAGAAALRSFVPGFELQRPWVLFAQCLASFGSNVLNATLSRSQATWRAGAAVSDAPAATPPPRSPLGVSNLSLGPGFGAAGLAAAGPARSFRDKNFSLSSQEPGAGAGGGGGGAAGASPKATFLAEMPVTTQLFFMYANGVLNSVCLITILNERFWFDAPSIADNIRNTWHFVVVATFLGFASATFIYYGKIFEKAVLSGVTAVVALSVGHHAFQEAQLIAPPSLRRDGAPVALVLAAVVVFFGGRRAGRAVKRTYIRV